jgi:hypothetical protein
LYKIKQFIVNVYTGKFIALHSPVNSLNSIFSVITTAAKSKAGFTIGTGVTFAFCYELDEILVYEGKEPYFVPGMKTVLRKSGSEELAKQFLNRLGITDRVDVNNVKSVTEVLARMSPEERTKY